MNYRYMRRARVSPVAAKSNELCEVKTMLSFECDYNNGAHSEVLKRIIETNNDKLPGYGSDCYCESAKSKIKQACKREDIDVFFI